MGLLNDYGRYGGRSDGAGPRSRFFSAPPPSMTPPSYTPPAGGGDSTQPVVRGVPERIKLDTILGQATNQPPETPAAIEMLGRAPGWVLGAPLSLGQTVGKAGGFDLFGFLGDVAQAIPFIPGINKETGDWNWSLGGFLGQAGAGLTEPITLVNQAVNAANADAIRTAQAGDPNDPAPFSLASALFHKFEPLGGETETNSEFLSRMGRLGWTPDEFSDLASGRDSWSFHDLNHRFSEDVWQDLAYNMLLDPLTYTPMVAAKGATFARATGRTFQATQVGQSTQAIANMLTGSQAALRARQGAGLATSLITRGALPAVYAPIRMASQAIRSGAAGAVQHATKWSVADAILTATRGSTFSTATRVGAAPLRPLGAMVRHAADFRGYVSGFRANTAEEIASAATAGRNAPSPFWRGMQGYASRATALRGTEFLFEQTAEGIDALLGDEDGENTALGGFTENLRELGHSLIREDPINSNLTGMIVAGFLYPGIPIVSEALGVAGRAGRSGAAATARNSIKGVWDDITWRPIAEGDIPNAPAFMRLFSDEDFSANRGARDRALKQVNKRLGGVQGVRHLWDAATTALVREQLIRALPNEWRIRSVASTAARAEVSASIYRRAREDLIRAGRLTDDDVMHAIMAMDEGTGGFDLARAAERANGATNNAGGSMRWNGELAARNWVRFMAASQPVNKVLIEKGHQVVAGIREYLPKETLTDMRAALMIARQGKGKDAYVTAGDIQRMLRDHPQLIALDGQGYWKQFAIMDADAPVKWNSVGRKLQNMEKAAPTWDEVMADVDAHEATGGPVTGMGEEPLRSGAVALDNGRIRYARAAPGEARVAVSRMNPELGPAPGTFREARALRSHPAIRAWETRVGATLHDSGINVDQVHQTVGGWASEGKVFREPSVSITMGRAATLDETRLTAAMTARSTAQQETLFWVTGSRLADLGVQPNAALGRITNISRRSQAKLETILHRRYGDGYTFDDTAGEAIMFVPDAKIADLLPDLEASLAEAGVKGTVGAEPAYVEFLGGDDIDNILKEHDGDVRLTRYNETIDRAINDPDFDDTALAERLRGTADRTFLASTKGGRGGRDGIRHGTLTQEGIIRDGIRRTQAEDGSVIPGLEAERKALQQQLRDLNTVRREALTRRQVLYKVSDRSDFDPYAPLSAAADAEVVSIADTAPSLVRDVQGNVLEVHDTPRSWPVGTVRNGYSGGEVLREVPVDSLTWAQDVLQVEVGQRMKGAPLTNEYGRAVLINGRLVLLDGHHRLNEAMRRGEGTVKVWVSEARENTSAEPGARSNTTEELPLGENYTTPLDEDALIYDAVDAEVLDVEEILGRQVEPTLVDEVIKQKYAAAEEQVLFNRTLDAEIDDLFPMLRYDRSTGSLSPDDLNAMRPAYHYLMKNFGGAYDLKVAPEMAFPITEVVPASLKVSTLLGEWVREYGPLSKVTAMVDWFRKPIDTSRQAKLARTAMYRQLIPRGATVKQVDNWVNEMSNMTSQFTIGPLRLKVFRDATALTPDWINKAAAKSFGKETIEAVGDDNFHIILDRAANRFIRDTMFPGLQGGRQGGSRGRLQRLMAQGYYIFQTGDPTGEIRPRGQRQQITGLRRAAESKRILAKTIYPIFRFMLDPRWHAMNRFEYNVLSGVKDGIWRPERRTGQFEKGRNVAGGDPISDFGAVTTQADIEQLPPGARRAANMSVDDALLDIESVGGGMLHNREAAGFIARLWQSRALDDIEQVVNQFPEMDAGLRDLMRLFPDDDTRSIYEKLNDFMYDSDMKGVKNTITEEAQRLWGVKVAEELEPMLNQIALRHQQTFDSVTQMLQGNPARNNIERIMNSYWLYWPISYQLKAGKWLFQALTEGFAGQKTNFGGASWVAYMTEKHMEKLATDPEYQQMMEDHEGLFLAATMMLPITPFDLGVSLNRGIRGVGGHLGWWEEYKRAQDPVVFATWMAELGPLYSIQLAQQVWGETFGSRNGDAENERTGGGISAGTAAPGFDSTVNAGTPVPTFGP